MIAAVPTIEILEQADVQTMIREVEVDPRHGFESTPGQGAAAQLRWLTGLIGIVFSGIVLARYSWWLPFVVILPAAVNYILLAQQDAIAVRLWQKAVTGELYADVWRKATMSSGPGKETRVFGLSRWMVNRMQEHIAAANMPFWRYINRVVIDEWRQLLLVMLGLVPAYIAVTLGVLNGTTTLAVQVMVLAAGAAVYRGLATSGDIYRMTGGAAILETTERLRRLLRPSARMSVPSQPGPSLQQSSNPRPPKIVFDEVTFRYPQSSRLILDRLTLEISAGESLALVGLNGSGKSTMIKLLSGLYAPTSGRILIDGQNLAELDLDEWRARIALIFQDFIHYPLSARENVALNGNGTVAWELDPTAARSGISTVIDRLPKGWDTPLSRSRTGGVDLSGGQWQQVALARALHRVHKGASLLVLDEPSAHLDVRTEAEVFGRLADLRGKVGLVLITHRLATVRNMERIAVLADGKIVESGSHDELMAMQGRYQEMFSIQARRFAQGYDDRIEEGELL
jgi:ATP-binding cassette subfamily B protein